MCLDGVAASVSPASTRDDLGADCRKSNEQSKEEGEGGEHRDRG